MQYLIKKIQLFLKYIFSTSSLAFTKKIYDGDIVFYFFSGESI